MSATSYPACDETSKTDIEVRTLTHAVYSGRWGGLVPDALIALSRGCTPGRRPIWSTRVASASRVRRDRRRSVDQEWDRGRTAVDQAQPHLNRLDAPRVDGASNTLTPSARAEGADLTLTVIDTGEATQIDATGPTYDAARAAFTEAWDGTASIDVGIGGSIPFIAEFVEAYPQASVLVTGVGVDRPAGLGGGSCSAAPQTPLPTSSRGPSLARCFDP